MPLPWLPVPRTAAMCLPAPTARGLRPALAAEVARQLTAHDALGTHARDELGISETVAASPVQAALASAATFTVGAARSLLVIPVSPERWLAWSVALTSLGFLAALGGLAAYVGGWLRGA